MRALWLLVLTAAFCSAAFAQSMSGSGIPDPFIPGEYLSPANHGNTDSNGKTVRNLTINTGVKNLVLILAGQSNECSEAPTQYTPTNGSAIDNFNVYDRSVYAWADPPLGSCLAALTGISGAGNGHVGARIADKFITAGTFSRVIVAPLGIGGTLVSQWQGSPLSNRICAVMKGLATRGFTSQTNVTVAMVWGQGESDNTNGTSQSAYTASLNAVIAAAKACGTINYVFVNVETWSGGTTSAGVQAAQGAVVDNVSVFAGGNLDTLNATNRLSDNIHFNDTGIASEATLIYNAMHAIGAPF